jgi:hypothetical protein
VRFCNNIRMEIHINKIYTLSFKWPAQHNLPSMKMKDLSHHISINCQKPGPC